MYKSRVTFGLGLKFKGHSHSAQHVRLAKMASQSSNTVTVNVGALSTAIAVAIQQATQESAGGTVALIADGAASLSNPCMSRSSATVHHTTTA